MVPDLEQKGFTLVELLVALVVMGILGIGAVRLFVAQHQSFRLQNDGVLATQNARAGFDMMTRELRNAGYDPRDTAGSAITTWTATGFGWTADLNADGDVADDGEAVLWFYQADPGELVRREGGVDVTVADGITGLELAYFADEDGTLATAPDEIEQVGMAMTYATPEGVPTGRLETQVAVRNNIYE
ncbi:hypothetical protein BH18GEM1_BH18GEM1_11960 [soil metagenome]